MARLELTWREESTGGGAKGTDKDKWNTEVLWMLSNFECQSRAR